MRQTGVGRPVFLVVRGLAYWYILLIFLVLKLIQHVFFFWNIFRKKLSVLFFTWILYYYQYFKLSIFHFSIILIHLWFMGIFFKNVSGNFFFLYIYSPYCDNLLCNVVCFAMDIQINIRYCIIAAMLFSFSPYCDKLLCNDVWLHRTCNSMFGYIHCMLPWMLICNGYTC